MTCHCWWCTPPEQRPQLPDGHNTKCARCGTPITVTCVSEPDNEPMHVCAECEVELEQQAAREHWKLAAPRSSTSQAVDVALQAKGKP